MIKITTYQIPPSPITIHHIGQGRYMLDTEHTYTALGYDNLLIDDETGVLYQVIESHNYNQILVIKEF